MNKKVVYGNRHIYFPAQNKRPINDPALTINI